MNLKTLKLIAIFSMLFDHMLRIFPLHKLLLPVASNLEVIYPAHGELICNLLLDTLPTILMFVGRLAAPVFMFCIANGYMHTSNIKRYLLRIFCFAALAQIPYILFFQAEAKVLGTEITPYEVNLNILFTLGLGLLAITCFERFKQNNRLIGFVSVLLIALFAKLIKTEGSEGYILIVFMFYLLKDVSKPKQAWVWIGVILLSRWKLLLWLSDDFDSAWRSTLLNTVGAYLGILLTFYYNGRKGNINKVLQYGFYWFYPIHLLLLAAIGFIII
ncbi:TraX family protein [Paenibacillus sp. NPDC056722]|uniref:TraX family protein n=1 Tax=Paenibacillus sp. NPDC056722 TaxID=3345924 RepID=UPI003682CD06